MAAPQFIGVATSSKRISSAGHTSCTLSARCRRPTAFRQATFDYARGLPTAGQRRRHDGPRLADASRSQNVRRPFRRRFMPGATRARRPATAASNVVRLPCRTGSSSLAEPSLDTPLRPQANSYSGPAPGLPHLKYVPDNRHAPGITPAATVLPRLADRCCPIGHVA